MTRILFAGGGTGGHLYPALALAEAVREQEPDAAIHFVGAERGVEAQVLPQRGVPHTLLPFEPLRRSQPWQNWRLVPSLFHSLRGLSRLFRSFRPSLVVGTGGYASAPACLWAAAMGVPVAIQEQNSYPGLTQRIAARFARQVHLGFPEAARHLKAGRHTEIHALGNPIRPPDATLDPLECRHDFGLRADALVVLVVGGSQGARAVNEALLDALTGVVAGALPWPDRMQILWATGPANFEVVSEQLRAIEMGDRVQTRAYIQEMPRALAAADIALSRAGAMATAELMAWGIPSVLVPLPTSAADHQRHNARALADAGAAIMLEETTLTTAGLWDAITGLGGDDAARERMAASARSRARPDAARDVATQLLRMQEAA
jgi:UDP-N-acetylglucosamine--N-acetylmuramyl-(pentapeptide) pyrophosphoryl-undecaprenol N-acetylglucosamine transferase